MLRAAARLAPIALAVTAWLAPRAALAQSAPAPFAPFAPLAPAPAEPKLASHSPLFRALGATMLGLDLGSATWLGAGALGSRDLKTDMIKPLPIGLALGATAIGAGAGALISTDDRRFMRLGIPIGGGIVTSSLVAMFGGGIWLLTCNEPAGPDRDACQHRAGRFFAGSLTIGTLLGGATGVVLALTVPPRPSRPRAATRVYVGPGSVLVKF